MILNSITVNDVQPGMAQKYADGKVESGVRNHGLSAITTANHSVEF